MIRWLVQSVQDHADLSAGLPPPGLLTPAELAHYNGYYSPRRRRDWLLGRWTAKHLIRDHWARVAGYRPNFTAFTIAQDPSGAPYVQGLISALTAAGECRLPLGISISHSHCHAVCAVTGGSTRGMIPRLGADIELVQTQEDLLTGEFFTPDERAAILASPPVGADLMMTATRSAKEAVLKATHLGLRADPHTVQCILRPQRPRMWTRYQIEFCAPPAPATTPGAQQSFGGWWRIIESRLRPGAIFVLTLAAQGTSL
jgi:4'-phosphopantetheinyl transferase